MREPLRLRRVQAPARLPVTLDEIKAQLRLEDDQTFEDALVMAAVRGATEHCELSTGRALVTQTWTLFRDRWPTGGSLPLPRAPLQAIVQVKTFAQDDSETIWPAENYTADTAGAPGRLVPRGGQSFPTPGRARQRHRGSIRRRLRRRSRGCPGGSTPGDSPNGRVPL